MATYFNKKHFSKLTIYVLFLGFISCKISPEDIPTYTPLYCTPSNIVSNFPGGSYSSQCLKLEFFSQGAERLVAVYDGDSVLTEGDSLKIEINLKPSKLMLIPTAAKKYKKYSHGWNYPKMPFSSFRQIKILSYKDDTLLDSLVSNYVLGVKKSDLLPVVNLEVDEEFLFSADSGCYVTGNSFNEEDEYNSGNYYLYKRRKQMSHIQIIDTANEYLNDNLLFRIHGYMTPLAPQKSLRFYMKDDSELKNLLGIEHEMDKFILRSSYSGWGWEIFVDGWVADACKGLHLDVMSYYPIKVYLNGEYWGLHGLRERMDLKAISNKYDLKVKKIVDADDKGYSYKDGEFGDLNTLIKKVKENPAFSFKEIKRQFKMKSLLDWVIVELFFQNWDWPCNNTFFWKKEKKSGEWRAVLLDMDASVNNPEWNMFEFATKDRSPSLGGELVTYLLNQPDFKILFKERVNYLLVNDLSTSMLLRKFNFYKHLFEPAVKEHYNRWDPDDGLSNYKDGLSRIEKFCNERPEAFKQNMKAFFKE
jgi:hypothetical protein